MMVYIIIFLITIVLCGFQANLKYITIGGNKVAIKQISFWIIYIYLLILGICRNEFLGADSSSYKIYYWDVYKNLDFVSAIHHDNDFGFGTVCWIISRFTDDYWIFRAVIYGVSFTIISIWIYKYSKNISVSFLLFLGFGHLKFDFTILRQVIAVSIFIWGFKFIIERKLLKYIIVIALAACFHKTVLFMIMLYPFGDKRIKNERAIVKIICLLGAIGIVVAGGSLITIFYQRQDYSGYLVKGEGYNLLLFYIILFLVLKLFVNRILQNDILKTELNLMVPNICIQIVATTFSLFTRMLFYTTPFTFILVPDILEELDVETRKTMVLILGVMLTLLFYVTYRNADIVPYITHWYRK